MRSGVSSWVFSFCAVTVLIASGRLGAQEEEGNTASSQNGTFSVLHSFTGGGDGANPRAGLAVGNNGALYGTTEYAGSLPTCPDCGTIFELKPPASSGSAWAESVIYAFPPFSLPSASPTVGRNGELYGTSYYGGVHYVGSVFELVPPSSPGGTWTETTLYSFSSANGAPQNPVADVVIGKNGVLYGTVQYAGASSACVYAGGFQGTFGCGGVFSLTPPASPGGVWNEQTLYIFNGDSDGAEPLTHVAIGKNGELYGTTYYGGQSSTCVQPSFRGDQTSGCGTVFELDPPAFSGGTWSETVLHSFTGGSDGGYPNSVFYHDGVLYGTVTFGGDPKNCGGIGCGGVFQLSPPASSGDSWTETVIYSFMSVPDGLYPAAGPIMGKDGKLYGTTHDGGDAKSCPENPGCGVVFELSPPSHPNGAWRERVLHRFAAAEGFRPTAGLAISNGDLYGTTYFGGTAATCTGGCGAVFKVQAK